MISQTSNSAAVVAELLELSATERPRLLEVHVEALLTSHLRLFVQELAAAFDLPYEKLPLAIAKACKDLDELEKINSPWRDPAQVLRSPNVVALIHICRARALRAPRGGRRRKLERILGRLVRAYEHARQRSWIEAFIGPPLPDSGTSEDP